MSVYYRYGGPVSDEQALTVPCPLCWSLTGQACIYVWPRSDLTGVGYGADMARYSPGIQAKIALVGTPTARAHNDRRRLYSLLHEGDERRRRTADRATAAAVRQMRRLRTWLLTHGDIFEEKSEKREDREP